jgi:hypothetical protein
MRRNVAVAALIVAGLFGAAGVEAQSNSDGSTSNLQRTPTERDGQKDFDFHNGTWKTRLKRLLRPLTGSTTWVEYEGTTQNMTVEIPVRSVVE